VATETSVAGSRRKNWRTLAIITLVAGIILGLASVAIASVRGPHIDHYWTVAALNGAGTARITEAIDYDFGLEERHGIYRDVPGLRRSDVVSVSSPSAPDSYEAIDGYRDDLRLKIGEKWTTIDGRHRYDLVFDLAVPDGDEIVWTAIGDGWERPIHEVEAHLVAPFELMSPGCVSEGGTCRLTEVAPGHLVVDVEGLERWQHVRVTAQRGADLPAVPSPGSPPPLPPTGQDFRFLLPVLSILAVLVAVALLFFRIMRLAGREQVRDGGAAEAAFDPDGDGPVRRVDHAELADLVTIMFSPPRGLAAHQAAIVLEEAVTNDAKVSWLLERVAAGELNLAEEGGVSVLTPGDVPSDDPVVQHMFATGTRIALGTYNSSFAGAWDMLDEQLAEWQQDSGLWRHDSSERVGNFQWLGAFGMLGGLVGTIVVLAAVAWEQPFALPTLGTAAILGAGTGVLLRAGELEVRTPAGTGRWLQAESFRRFFVESEAEHVERAAEQGRLREYTAWAVAVGEVDRWSSSMEQAAASTTSSYVYDPYDLMLMHSLSSMHRSTRSTSVEPSSSSGGDFDFGGFSGGGGGSFGGGGGGDW